MQITIDANEFTRLGNVLAAIGDTDTKRAIVRALNHTGSKAYTQVKRAMVGQTGMPYGVVNKGVKRKLAHTGSASGTGGSMEFVIIGTGKPLSLKYFKARQTRKGVSAAPWNVRRIFPGTFNTGGSFEKGRVSVLGGHVFKRTSAKRGPLEKLYGPGIANELIKDEVKATFERVASELPDRLSHEIERLLPR